VEYLIKDLISKHIIDTIDKEIERLKDERVDQGLEELSDSEIIFAKMNKVETFTDDKADDPKAKRFGFIAKSLMDRISDLRAEIDPSTFDQLNVRENLKNRGYGNIRNRGFNTAINSITSILDTSKWVPVHREPQNARELLIREYEDTDAANLPDERYQIRMRYYDNAQLIEDRKAYDVQIKSFENEVLHLWDVLSMIYEDSKFLTRVTDFADLAKLYKKKIRKILKRRPAIRYMRISPRCGTKYHLSNPRKRKWNG